MTAQCPLCTNTGVSFYKNEKSHFYQCEVCKGIFADKKLQLNIVQEKERYRHHKNNIHDAGYIKFADPIISSVKKHFNKTHKGLDFGAGHTPVISEILKNSDYQIEIYDPLFFDHRELLKNTYDFITSCEVIEHFYHPDKEFTLLHNMLKPHGKLICMTYTYDHTIDFDNWFYKNDPTHVFLYQHETFQWIKNNFGFSKVELDNRLIIFTK
ncbi:MAG: class I SAM-dependent methyltransferase [Flavobacteriaceae bacterium]|nr:class I SAM-dependent methyltransferase [Flavobacteriaceae bacterium]